MHTFLWHDYESFGVNARRDRPAQFAGIRTDPDLNIIGEPINIFCQPSPDFIPSLQACLVTGITPQQALQKGLPEYQFAARVEAVLSAEGTIGTGYNTLSFDDEMTRFMFWRNLIPPYDREFKNDCGRWDIIDMMRVMHAFRPDGIIWPERENGSSSFRLEHLTAANGLAHESAHDALSDVIGTIGLARLVKQLQPKLFDYCFTMRSKHSVQRIIQIGQPFVHVAYSHPKENGHIGILMPISINPKNPSEVICWNLSKEPGLLKTMAPEEIKARLFKKTSELAEGEERIPLATVTVNKSPMVFNSFAMLTPEIQNKWQIDLEAAKKNAGRLAEIGAEIQLQPMLGKIYTREFEDSDPDEALYGGFISNGDRRKLDMIRMMPPEKIDGAGYRFDDPKLEEVVFRYRARNFPNTLSDTEHQRWHALVNDRIVNGQGDHRTIGALTADINALPADAPERSREIARELMSYAQTVVEANAFSDISTPPAPAEETAAPAAVA